MISKGWLFFILITLLFFGTLTVHAESLTDTDAIKQLYQQREYEKVIEEGNRYLEHYQNNDPDIRYFVGLAFYQTQQYAKAEKQFHLALEAYPDYLDIRKAYIKSLLAQEHFRQASVLIKAGLEKHPEDVELLMDQVRIHVLQQNYKLAGTKLKKLLQKHPDYEPALTMQHNLSLIEEEKIKSKKAKKHTPKSPHKKIQSKQVKQDKKPALSERPHLPYYNLGIATSIMDSSLPQQTWNYSTLYLYRNQENISYGAELNYANRINRQAYQGGLVLSPKVSDKTWFDLAYYYAHQPALFPDHTFYGNFNQVLFNDFVVNASVSHKKIARTYFNTVEGGIKAFVGNWTFRVSPIYYQTKSGPDSTLYKFHARYYFDDPDTFFGLIVMTGYSPDLYNLLTVNFFRVHEKIIMGESQFPLNKSFIVSIGGGYENQQFLRNIERNLFYLNMGLKYRFDHVN